MRSFRFVIPMALAVSCVDKPVEVQPPPADATPPGTPLVPMETTDGVQLIPLTGTGLRFDGAYRFTIGDLRYYMRFFERGNAAFVGGTEKYPGQLASLLTIDVKSGWNQVHNCPVVQRNDSLFIRSVGLKGVINYSGDVRANGDSVLFLRVSEINGVRQLFAYAFIPDSELVPEP